MGSCGPETLVCLQILVDQHGISDFECVFVGFGIFHREIFERSMEIASAENSKP